MQNPLRASRTRIAAVAAAVLFGAGAGAAVVTALDSDQNAPQVSASEAASPIATSTSTVGEIYERSAAGVVEITVGSAGAGSLGGGGATQAQGSGFVYDDQGHIITNQHVVDGAESVSVRFSDGSTHDATVVGSDPSTDLAVLKVDAPASLLKPLRLGKSSELAVGDGVIAIGSPFGLEQTVTTGIVSALNRQINSPNGFAIDDAIQTDAAINHGNSGGPLLDLEGRVIGVNSQIESESGGNDGIGFAVPSDTVARIARGPDRRRRGRARLPRRRDRGHVERRRRQHRRGPARHPRCGRRAPRRRRRHRDRRRGRCRRG